ncbi:MAG: terminase family protein [Lentisphaeria bacterium]|nr:terminase family protein [Lentisphaeria bacterium]
MGRAKIIPAGSALLLPYQRRWVLDDSRIKLMEKSRQIGISWASAYGLIRRKSLADARLDAWVSSRDEIQARLFLDDCKNFAEILHTAVQDLGVQIVDKSQTYILELANKLKINSMSSSPDAQAGKRGDRFLDEFALHPDPRKLYSIAYPGITWGGQLEIVSTHRGSHNYFNELVKEIREKGNPKKVSLHRITLEDALNDGFLYRLQQKLPAGDERQEMDEGDYFNSVKAGCADEESFLQEYMCVPGDDASAFLSYDLIASCERSDLPDLADLADFSDLAGKDLYLGVDVGRKKDLTCFWLNSLEGSRHICRRMIVMQNRTFAEQEDVLYKLLELPGLRRCCIDASGLGMQFAERAVEKFGTYRVEGIQFTGPVKEALAYPVKAAFEDLNLRIPEDRFLRADLRAIRKETTAAGNIRFSADRSENGHADRFWALALAIHAAGNGNIGPCRFMPAGGIRNEKYPVRREDEIRKKTWL